MNARVVRDVKTLSRHQLAYLLEEYTENREPLDSLGKLMFEELCKRVEIPKKES